MTQWLLEEALLERLDTERDLGELARLEQLELRHTADELKREATDALG